METTCEMDTRWYPPVISWVIIPMNTMKYFTSQSTQTLIGLTNPLNANELGHHIVINRGRTPITEDTFLKKKINRTAPVQGLTSQCSES